MRCANCGHSLANDARYCEECGAAVIHAETTIKGEPTPAVGFFEAVKLYFIHYADFHGRSRRSEYWNIVLFNMLAGFLISAIIPDLAWIWTLATLIPGLSLCVRRLHDVGKSGWWYLFLLLPLIGTIILLVQLCKDSEGDNQWGPSPKY